MHLGIRALQKLEAFHNPLTPCPAAVAGVESGIRLERLRQPDYPCPIWSPFGHGTPIENHPTVGQTAQVHPGSTPELNPLPISEGLGWGLGEKMAPVGFPASDLESAGLTVRTRSNDVKLFPQLLAQGD
jgi:hypothetical protein